MTRLVPASLTLLAAGCFIIGSVAVAVPYWGHFRNRVGKLCIHKHVANINKCKDFVNLSFYFKYSNPDTWALGKFVNMLTTGGRCVAGNSSCTSQHVMMRVSKYVCAYFIDIYGFLHIFSCCTRDRNMCCGWCLLYWNIWPVVCILCQFDLSSNLSKHIKV